MKKTNKTKPTDKVYLVTEDLACVLSRWCSREGLSSPSPIVFNKFRDHVMRDLQDLVFKDTPEGESVIEVNFSPLKDFAHLIKQKTDDKFWIALDDVYVRNEDKSSTAERRFFRLHVTRLYDKHGLRKLGLGARPEATQKTIQAQLEDCRSAYVAAGKPSKVVLADDGTFTGDTVLDVIQRLKGIGIRVGGIRLGFSRADSINEFYKSDPSFDIVPGFTKSKDGLLDWVCERDFFIGAPRSGRTLGRDINGTFRADDGPIVGLPYIKPWGPIWEGANICCGQHELSARLTGYSIEIWQEIQRKNAGVKLTVAKMPRFPGPPEPCKDILVMPIVQYLETVEKWMFGSEFQKARKKKPLLGA